MIDASIIMPFKNDRSTLHDAIDSVLLSRGVTFELICINDGSTDGSEEQLKTLAQSDLRIRVLDSPGRGIVDALEAGRAVASSPWIARMDADDEMHPDRLAAQLAFALEHPEIHLIGCQVESFRDGGLETGYQIYTDWVNGLIDSDAIAREAFIECPVPHPTWFLANETLDQLGGYQDHGWPEDLDLIYRLLASGGRAAKVPRILHRWRDRPDRLSRTSPVYDRKNFARAKAHYLPLVHPMTGAVVWGAGKTGRRLVKLLEAEKLPVRILLDIHPDRIGTDWNGIPILSPEQIRKHWQDWRREGLKIVTAVASRGARQEIRSFLLAAGLKEGEDFLLAA